MVFPHLPAHLTCLPISHLEVSTNELCHIIRVDLQRVVVPRVAFEPETDAEVGISVDSTIDVAAHVLALIAALFASHVTKVHVAFVELLHGPSTFQPGYLEFKCVEW